jgi:3-isopropylmalate/(R)-2-methylmalate dehydratase small subunit
MKIKGRIIKYGDNINTDEIIPARFLNTSDEKELAKHCMEGIDRDFLKKIKEKKILIAGRNFGCGSSREHAPLALKEAGIKCIVASSFSRIFFRNAINIALPIIESGEAAEKIREGDMIEVDINKGVIENLTRKESYSTIPFPPFLQKIIEKGGLEGYIKTKAKK